MKKVIILGSTGSIGSQVVDVCEKYPHEFKIIGIAASKNIEKITEQIKRINPKYVCIYHEYAAKQLREIVTGQSITVLQGISGLEEIVSLPEADTIVIGIPGSVGLRPTLAAIRAKKIVIDANKESVAIAGDIIMREVREKNICFLPLDGEHIAIHQCLMGEKAEEIKRVILTASGGAFRDINTREALENVTWRDALKHPTWSMGAKITIDCATLINKGLEIIVAHHLFDVPYNKIDVIVHRESIIHSMVEFIDGSIIAQLSVNDMRLAALYALSYPERMVGKYNFLDLIATGQLTFEEPRTDLFPCLNLAIKAGIEGGTAPAVLNAANEIAVNAFLQDRIKFLDIPMIVETMLEKNTKIPEPTLEEIIEVDAQTRTVTTEFIDSNF